MVLTKKVKDYLLTFEDLKDSTNVPMGAVVASGEMLDNARHELVKSSRFVMMKGLQTSDLERAVTEGKILVFDLRHEDVQTVRSLLAAAEEGSLTLRTAQDQSNVIDPLPKGTGFLLLCEDQIPDNFETLITSVCRE